MVLGASSLRSLPLLTSSNLSFSLRCSSSDRSFAAFFPKIMISYRPCSSAKACWTSSRSSPPLSIPRMTSLRDSSCDETQCKRRAKRVAEDWLFMQIVTWLLTPVLLTSLILLSSASFSSSIRSLASLSSCSFLARASLMSCFLYSSLCFGLTLRRVRDRGIRNIRQSVARRRRSATLTSSSTLQW